ncbi:NlpC/P60 family protein [Nonomuraea sp. NPDC050310]|uniref:C40 family peptidase n=1 Tax=unclassified Nonomuraea TaxID=2593643 RepID=UPI0033C0B5E2
MKRMFITSGALLLVCTAPLSFPAQSQAAARSQAAALARGEIAAQAAVRMIGTPYSWGGGGATGPSFGMGRGARTKGFDCAGLTEYAWAQAGVRIGSTTYQQWRAGARVARSRLQPGDLVFFETNARREGPDHVGVAVDADRMVVAPFTGTVVRVERIDRKDLAGIVRPAATEWRPRKAPLWRGKRLTGTGVRREPGGDMKLPLIRSLGS